MTQESLEQGAPSHATVPMQQAVTDTQGNATIRDVRQDGQETTVKVIANSQMDQINGFMFLYNGNILPLAPPPPSTKG